jgi:transposase
MDKRTTMTTTSTTTSTTTRLPVLGIDISKATFDVALLRDAQTRKAKTRKFDNRPGGFQALCAWLAKQGVAQVHVVLEATGAYGDALAEFLHDAGQVVSVVNPAQIKAFGQAELQRNKTDRADAALIARFGLRQQPAPWTPPAPELRALQALMRHLDDLIEQRTQISNRLSEGRLTSAVEKSWQQVLATLETQITSIKEQVETHFEQHPQLKMQRELLDSIPGIAAETAARLLAEIPQLAALGSARAAAAYSGLTPRRHQSGTSVNAPARMSKIGNARVRYALYFPALTALRCNPSFQQLAARLAAKGKHKMQIIGAAMHKLVRLAYGVLKNQQAYDKNYLVGA